MKLLAFVAVTVLFSHSDCARILGIFPGPGYSQFILAEKLMTTLAARGHQVTVISPFAPKSDPKNYRSILTENYESFDDLNLYDFQYSSHFRTIHEVYVDVGLPLTEVLLNNSKVQEFITNKNETFDLVITELVFNEAHLGFAAHFKAPLILFSSLRANEWVNYVVGNPAPPSYFPHSILGYTTKMNMVQRFWNSVFYVYDHAIRSILVLPKQEKLLRKYFPSVQKRLEEIASNVSLVLLNAHPAVTEALPMVRNMVEIGGFHVDPKPLPKDLQEYLDGAKEGAIFFSMGSNLKSKDLSAEMRKEILEMFSRLKQKVLWKFEDENLPGKPDNVKIGKWLPQSSILAHPNTKLFISHCGLLSTTETVHSAVPLICVPIFADQPMNAAVVKQNGLGIVVTYTELNGKTLGAAINEILNNEKYKKNMVERSWMLRDNPMPPLDSAMYWIEYVIRHKGVSHLKSPSNEITWYQYLLLDIICIVLVTAIVCRKLIQKIVCFLFVKKNPNIIKKQN